MEKLELHIKEKVSDLLKGLKIFRDSINDDNEKIAIARESVKNLRASNPDLKVDEVKSFLVDIQIRSWETYVKDSDLIKLVGPLAEYKNTAQMFNIDLGLSEEDTKLLESLTAGGVSMYIPVEGKLVLSYPEQYETLRTKAKTNAENPQNLEEMLKSDFFK